MLMASVALHLLTVCRVSEPALKYALSCSKSQKCQMQSSNSGAGNFDEAAIRIQVRYYAANGWVVVTIEQMLSFGA